MVRQSETGQGIRGGLSTPERENRELNRANEILRKTSIYFAKGHSVVGRNDSGID
jgi:transposase-like protein